MFQKILSDIYMLDTYDYMHNDIVDYMSNIILVVSVTFIV